MWEIPIFRKDPVERCDGDLKGCSFDASQPTLKHTLNYPTFSGCAIFSSPSSWWPSSGDVPIGVASEKNSSEDKMAFYMLESGPTSNRARPRSTRYNKGLWTAACNSVDKTTPYITSILGNQKYLRTTQVIFDWA
ncbi:uncharacterized protein LACBIDRAFT_328919 [Laccaria bicolor S238N-H82]|uniref:Predicted protein n=1 Tax=Laccaria bicolor (strain S238N-H82 / ATCC MYA-4686) TaxID=486041 RepID=B0DGF8_LACBS|nr:uncharacterized protein LACBIDRAFT_328919 [Laccaria bicolor S238N-H82]EDR06147.1 predicted protein [Laccaria bicolor S238N-H82]|eukprot:XP_001883008.1 predicted protein [Laccaria bicolor S238N-H82]